MSIDRETEFRSEVLTALGKLRILASGSVTRGRRRRWTDREPGQRPVTMTDFRTIAKLAEERLNAAVNKFDQTRSRDCDAIMLQPAKWVVKPEPESFKNEPAENCVDCKQPTRMWTLDGHTPLCKACCEKRNAPGK